VTGKPFLTLGKYHLSREKAHAHGRRQEADSQSSLCGNAKAGSGEGAVETRGGEVSVAPISLLC
jgi:hypothetical protein